MGFLQNFSRQFSHPKGWLGYIAGRLMAYGNREINRWTLSLLDIGPKDRVLEIGFGPGVALAEVTQIAQGGFVAGIDPSEAMLKQAGKRNQKAIREGRLELKLGAVSALPYPDEYFDKVFSVNVIQFWPNPIEDLKEMRRVLKKGGTVAATLQPRWTRDETMIDEIGREMVNQFSAAGFGNVRMFKKPTRPMTTVCVIGVKH